MQLVVKSTGAGMSSNSRCWFCHAVPKLPFRWEKRLFQFRVAVGRQHLGVGVDIDALAFGLLQRHLAS